MNKSPLSGLKQQQTAPAMAPSQPVTSPAVAAGSPLQKLAPTSKPTNQFLMPVKESDIEALGEDNSAAVQATTEKITQKFTVNNFGDMGDILTNVRIQADSLDLSEYTQKGILGKLRRGMTDIRKLLYKRMTSASEAFDELNTRISNQIGVLAEWNKDLAALYQENYQNHQRLSEQIRQGEAMEQQMKMAIDNFPKFDANDPDAFIKSQQLQEARTLLNLLQTKIDTWRRLQIICESHGPNIQNKQMASRNAIDTLKRLMTEMIPMVKMEFAMHLHNLEVQKSITLVDATTELGNAALTQSADSSRDAALAAARAANTPMISTSTLNHIRQRMLEAATGVNQIREAGEAQRAADAIEMKKSQEQYLAQLQDKGVV